MSWLLVMKSSNQSTCPKSKVTRIYLHFNQTKYTFIMIQNQQHVLVTVKSVTRDMLWWYLITIMLVTKVIL